MAGNHALAVAHAAKCVDPALSPTIFLPTTAAPSKVWRCWWMQAPIVGSQVEKLRKSGATLKFHGSDSERTESHARAYAREHGMVRIPQVFQFRLIVMYL
jgi:threonine dehydratase